MSFQHGLKRPLRGVSALPSRPSRWGSRFLHRHGPARAGITSDGRNRLTSFWTPAQRKSNVEAENDSHQLLLRAGFLRQAHSGIFHLLPLGLRVQDKIEALIDRHMTRIGASKVSLSSISSQELWRRSGRLHGRDSEFFRLEDRKEAKYLLSPTHEEEITTIVANAVHSYKDLPLRLYQVSRKYRDEARPRQGLLRGREFVMKDLYTFDVTELEARETYEQVRAAYRAFLDDLGIPYAVAQADSGNMGGKLSHEYHFISSNGEDTIISCDSCDMVLNEELYTGAHHTRGQHDGQRADPLPGTSHRPWHGVTRDRKTAVYVYVPDGPYEVNTHAVKHHIPDLDPGAQANERSARHFENRVALIDPRLTPDSISEIQSARPTTTLVSPTTLTRVRRGDACPDCSAGTVSLSPAVEIGHTFHLGTRYSVPLGASVLDATNRTVPVEMGCHGIGVSRLIGAVGALLADSKGLNWPLTIAPFGALILGSASAGASPEDLAEVYDGLTATTGLDAIIDDRDRSLGWKLNDADAVGYPFIVVLGKAWGLRRAVELQCRRLGVREEVAIEELAKSVATYSANL